MQFWYTTWLYIWITMTHAKYRVDQKLNISVLIWNWQVILLVVYTTDWRRSQRRHPKNTYWRRTWRRWRRSGVTCVLSLSNIATRSVVTFHSRHWLKIPKYITVGNTQWEIPITVADFCIIKVQQNGSFEAQKCIRNVLWLGCSIIDSLLPLCITVTVTESFVLRPH